MYEPIQRLRLLLNVGLGDDGSGVELVVLGSRQGESQLFTHLCLSEVTETIT